MQEVTDVWHCAAGSVILTRARIDNTLVALRHFDIGGESQIGAILRHR